MVEMDFSDTPASVTRIVNRVLLFVVVPKEILIGDLDLPSMADKINSKIIGV